MGFLALLPAIEEILPFLVKLLGLVLDKADANSQLKAAYSALVQAAKDDGKISADTKDVFQSQRDKIAAELAADAAAKAKAVLTPPTSVVLPGPGAVKS